MRRNLPVHYGVQSFVFLRLDNHFQDLSFILSAVILYIVFYHELTQRDEPRHIWAHSSNARYRRILATAFQSSRCCCLLEDHICDGARIDEIELFHIPFPLFPRFDMFVVLGTFCHSGQGE